ncbi:hypothetical protein BIV57_18370 [Mangrovactinospora gilvigrisea]|uniref:UDP-N-acetylglucosamine kinase n=1 Tax=Mangrovactinospora gilvigrisea TaxID=1428644 RepID=A0A1J7C395_9ACTN|nr:zeta toxin family protein [Mangrovactinospora gilvigrisea]OIV36024.1 hypothetical protein BIV57_18370 [Mangrovactinospora gilvigrisea]
MSTHQAGQPTHATPSHLVDRLTPFPWDSEAAFAYETAVEDLNALAGACTAGFAAATSRGDHALADSLAERRRACHRRRAALQPTDEEAVARTRAEASAAADAVRNRAAGPVATRRAATVPAQPSPDGQLSEVHNSKIFQEEIVPDLLDGPEHRAAPVAVVLLGQQGASKTRMAKEIVPGLAAGGGHADIDADYYKPYHPAYDGLINSDDRILALRTGRDGQRWMRLALGHAREQRVNILVHETAQSPAYFEDLLQGFRRDGYRVEVLVLGVPEAMSRQGILKRYHEQVRDRGHGRLTVTTKASRSYEGILEAADLIDRGHLADTVAVVRRGGSLQYRNSLTEDATAWTDEPRLRAAIDEERLRPWTPEETADFLRVHARLTAELDPKWQPELDHISHLADPLKA